MTSSPASNRNVCVNAATPPIVQNVSQTIKKSTANATPLLRTMSAPHDGPPSPNTPASAARMATRTARATISPIAQPASQTTRNAPLKYRPKPSGRNDLSAMLCSRLSKVFTDRLIGSEGRRRHVPWKLAIMAQTEVTYDIPDHCHGRFAAIRNSSITISSSLWPSMMT
jgi:hypothetical protein